MGIQYRVTLTKEEVETLQSICSKGKHSSRTVLCARALLLLDRSDNTSDHWKMDDVSSALGMSTRTLSHLKERFVTDGLERALNRKPQEHPSRPVKFDGEFEAKLTQLACTDPPKGFARWTVRLLADKLVEMEIVIRKVDANSEETLTGAKFRLDQYRDAEYRELLKSWEEKAVSTETGKEGTLKFEGLGIGYFKLVETETPAGYIKASTDPTFSISVNSSTGKLEVNFTDTDLVSYKTETQIDEENEEEVHLFTVKNTPGAALPNTGGPGTRLFTILGSILILGAGVLLWRRRRLI